MKAFNVYVRPILEYNSPVWNPFLTQDVNSIEYVQRFFTRRAFRRCKIPYSSYEDRLNKINAVKLSTRRQTTDHIMTYKILNNLVDIPVTDILRYRNTPYRLRGHNLALEAPRRNSSSARNFFGQRVVKTWNNLQSEVVNSTNLASFKTKLKNSQAS